MKDFFFILMLGFMPFMSKAQVYNGVKFESTSTWNQIKTKAKDEHKFIFVDAYASWCIPCKEMDDKVYTDSLVGNLTSANFISIKVQMDSVKNDNGSTNYNYENASFFKKYVDAYPTLLFFSSEGELIDKEVGYQDSKKLKSILSKVVNPQSNYIAKIQAFYNGRLRKEEMFKLAMESDAQKDKVTALRIAKVYKEKFLNGRNLPEMVLSPDIDLFMRTFSELFSFDDPIVKFIYKNPSLTAKLTKDDNFAEGYIQYLVRRDKFLTLKDHQGKPITGTPDWEKIEMSLAKEFDSITAKRAVLAEKIAFYNYRKDYDMQAKYEFEQVEFRGLDTANLPTINDMIYVAIFLQDVNKQNLEKAIRYMEFLLKAEPNNYHFVDTYANILYKAGYKQKAIEQEQKAFQLAEKDNAWNLVEFQDKISKMKNDIPTWKVASGN